MNTLSGLGPNQLQWCRQWLGKPFIDAEGAVLAAKAHALEVRAKIGEPTPHLVSLPPPPIRADLPDPWAGEIGRDIAPRPPSLVRRLVETVRRG